MNIRVFEDRDSNAVIQIVESAFPIEERAIIASVAKQLMVVQTKPPVISLVAEKNNEVGGYVSYSPIFTSDGHQPSGYILAPLAVSPNHQRMGIGCKLITIGKEILVHNGVDALLVYGDPDYYGRFGFNRETAKNFVPPYQLEYPDGWLGIWLDENKQTQNEIRFTPVEPLSSPELW